MPPVKLQVVMTIPGKDPREFEYEFDQDKISIGRDQTNDIQVPLSTVSRVHCTFSHENREWYLEDLKSTHGTRHNGKPVGQGGKKLLRDLDVVELVHFKITFHAEKQRSQDYSVEKTEALARKMVEEVLAQIGNDPAAMPYLRVMNGPEEGKKLNIGPDIVEATIGRGSDCDFQINDANVSRRHAIIRRDWNDITVEDAGSKNGVVVNDRRITRPTALRDRDEIMLGAMRLTYIDPSAKFLGKLDDIPAFQEQLTSAEGPEEHDPDDEGDDEPGAHEEGGESGGSDEGAGPEPAPEPPPVAPTAPTKTARIQGTAVADEEGPEPGPFDDDEEPPPPPRAVGPVEIGLIVLAVMAIAGLAFGVAFLFFQQ
ncbi:MAG: FHA domain-containing protein [Deltaproteobacteria bacterium]|nr:FHA domain-containing protein [Deltaproteobacteria bacterium]